MTAANYARDSRPSRPVREVKIRSELACLQFLGVVEPRKCLLMSAWMEFIMPVGHRSMQAFVRSKEASQNGRNRFQLPQIATFCTQKSMQLCANCILLDSIQFVALIGLCKNLCKLHKHTANWNCWNGKQKCSRQNFLRQVLGNFFFRF